MRKAYKLLLFFTILLFTPSLVNAQEVQSISESDSKSGNIVVNSVIGENEAQLTFKDLGFFDETLQSPYDGTRIRFSTPPNWKLVPGGEVVLEYEVFFTGEDVLLLGDLVSNFVGELVLVFNDQAIGNIYLNENGLQTETLQLPVEGLEPVRGDGRHELDISLIAGISCDYDIRTIVVIKSISYISLQFNQIPPDLTLAKLPFPFYLSDSIVQDQTFLVVPEDPDPLELQAAFNVSSGFGSMTSSDYSLGLITEGQLDETYLQESNFIFVGQPNKFEVLVDVDFSIPVSETGFVGMDPVSMDDGVIQIALSPWNVNKAILLVSGNSLPAVNKAAQAVSAGNIFVNDDPRVVFIADVQTLLSNFVAVESFSLIDLGYESETISGIGSDNIVFTFFVAKDQVATNEGVVELKYYHSSSLDYVGSSMVVRLNNEIIASEVFSEESSQRTTQTIDIPPGTLRFGENRLLISGNLLPYDSCDIGGISEYYLTIENDTRLHIPKSKYDPTQQSVLVDLQLFPKLFLSESDLGNIAFVIPRGSSFSWDLAAKLAYMLGDEANASISNLTAAYADDVSAEVRENNHIIVVGRSSVLPLLTEINDQLPAPFDFDTDTASEKQSQVIYRLPPGSNVGYLEILVSPFDRSHAMMIVSGNSGIGVRLAGDALLLKELNRDLAGLFAVTNGTQVKTSRIFTPYGINVTQTSITGEVVPDAEEIVIAKIPDLVFPSIDRPSWLNIFMMASVAVTIVILLTAFVVGIRRSKQ